MNRIHIKLQTAPLDQIQDCEDALNEWANLRLDDGCSIRELALRTTATAVVVLAVADAPEFQPWQPPPALASAMEADDTPCRDADTGNPTDEATEHSAPDPPAEPDSEGEAETRLAATDPAQEEQDPLERLFAADAEEPCRNQQQAQMLSLFDGAWPEEGNCHRPPEPAEPRSPTDWQLSRSSNTWWRRYENDNTGQVGEKRERREGRAGFWWRIIGPGGTHLAKGSARTTDEGRAACDQTMASPSPA